MTGARNTPDFDGVARMLRLPTPTITRFLATSDPWFFATVSAVAHSAAPRFRFSNRPVATPADVAVTDSNSGASGTKL